MEMTGNKFFKNSPLDLQAGKQQIKGWTQNSNLNTTLIRASGRVRVQGKASTAIVLDFDGVRGQGAPGSTR
jgi:hypothetical protein